MRFDMSVNAANTITDDPWDWSVDQVVGELCRVGSNRPSWSSPTDHLPDPVVLEQELRDNDVTGEVVLTGVTNDVLRNDLNIKSMGQRHAIQKGIHHLRLRSQKFQASASNPAIALPFTPLHSWLQASGPPYDHPSYIAGSVQSGGPGQTFDSPRLALHPNPLGTFPAHSIENHGTALPLPARPSPSNSTPNEIARDVPVDAAPPTNVERDNAAPAQQKAAVKVRRRIAPTFVAHLDKSAVRAAPLFGEDDVAGQDNSGEDNTSEREFQIVGGHVASHQRIHAYRQTKKYLTKSNKHTLDLRQKSSTIRAAAAPQDYAKNTTPQQHQRGQDLDDEFMYLLARHPPRPDDEDVLALYGDSGEDGEFDEETWHEMDKEKEEDKENTHSQSSLSLPEIHSIIDKAIQEFQTNWQQEKLAKVQAKAFRLWNRANREGRVPNEIATAEFWIRRLEKSVAKLREAIARETWPNAQALHKQCQSLEESVFQQAEHKYNIVTLKSMTAPPRPHRKSIKHAISRPVNLSEGDIVLDSESDVSMSNFIDDDETRSTSTALPHMQIKKSRSASATGDSDSVISPMVRRRKVKAQATSIDPRKNPFIDEGSSSSAESLPSRADSDLDLPAALPESRYENLGHERSMPIELVTSSEASTPATTGASDISGFYLNDDEENQPSTPSRITVTVTPLVLDVEAIRRMSWDTIENRSDRRRALAKAVYSMRPDKALQVRDFLEQYASESEDLQIFLQRGFTSILNRSRNIEGVVKSHWGTTRITTLLFASYCLATRMLREPSIEKDRMLKAQGLIVSGVTPFLNLLREIIGNYQPPELSRKGKRTPSNTGSQATDSWTSDSGSPNPQQISASAKKRRRLVKESQTAKSSQLLGQQRLHEQAQRTAMMKLKFQDIPRNMMDPASHAIGMGEPIIYLDPKIGGKVKDHQVNGIRFMWRELMTDENKQGCLLAHTMGLGKTMQVISLLVTIAQSIKSPDAGIRNQIPADLRDLKALILCPPSLIDNWYEEILMWRPDQDILGGLYKITQKTKLVDRVQDITHWAATTGILIISYDMFRNMIVNKAQSRRNSDERPISDATYANVERNLLECPNIIIADEAHKMKNTDAGISMVASRFKSTRRIALTGSPLANNLDEYFAMIDWIAPGYLGTKEHFRFKYSTPISEGLWNESTSHDRRQSLRKLHVLKKNLDPKVSRADISAIADDLPSKTEFFITVPLTKLQTKAYNMYVTSLLTSDGIGTSANTRLWDWLAVLSLLCNHPSTFLNKLDERQYAAGNKAMTTDDADGAGLPADVKPENAGLSPELVRIQHETFKAAEESGDLEAPSLSHRSQIVCDIIKFSVAAGDKVLLFSHSIPTLNYLEAMISSLGVSTCRLDGSTNVTLRQKAVKEFNQGAMYNVFLISTKAGGLGLNLQGANRVILFDYGFNPIWEEQAIGRAYRLGQQKAVFVYRLRAGGTFEELIYNKAVFKTQLAFRVIDKKNPIRHASKKASDYLFHVRDVPQEDLTPYYGKDPKVLDEVLKRSQSIRGIILTETFQKEEDEALTLEDLQIADIELRDEQEQRRDPHGFVRKRAEQQIGQQLNIRAPLQGPLPRAQMQGSFSARPSPQTQTVALEPRRLYMMPPTMPSTMPPTMHPHMHPTMPSTMPPTMHPTKPWNFPLSIPNQQMNYISRPEAIGGPQQTEDGMWLPRQPTHLQGQAQTVLGVPGSTHQFSPAGYPSPTTDRPPPPNGTSTAPEGTSTAAPEFRSVPNRLLDGKADTEKEVPDADLEQCKTQ
jgi:SNF2 family DNA or RNA helicase